MHVHWLRAFPSITPDLENGPFWDGARLTDPVTSPAGLVLASQVAFTEPAMAALKANVQDHRD